MYRIWSEPRMKKLHSWGELFSLPNQKVPLYSSTSSEVGGTDIIFFFFLEASRHDYWTMSGWDYSKQPQIHVGPV